MTTEHSPEFAQIDQHIKEINAIITKICHKRVRDVCNDQSTDSVTEGDIRCLYDEALLAIISRFLSLSHEFKNAYVEACLEIGKETEKLR